MKKYALFIFLIPLICYSQKLIIADNHKIPEYKLSKDMLLLSSGYGNRNFYKYSDSLFIMHAKNNALIGMRYFNKHQWSEFINALKMIKGRNVGDRVVMESKNVSIEVVNPWGKKLFYQINFHLQNASADLSDLSDTEKEKLLSTSNIESVKILGNDTNVVDKAKIIMYETLEIFVQLNEKEINRLINTIL